MNEALLSKRVRDSASPIATLRAPASEDVILLDGGPPDPATHPTAAMANLMSDIFGANERRVLGYGYEFGDDRLREAVAARAALDGARLTADQVVLTNGSSGALGLTALSLLEPGDTVVAEALTYASGLKAFKQMGARIESVPMDAGGLDPDALASILRRVDAQGGRVKFIYTISTNHNPTNTTLNLERRREVARLAQSHGALIVQDDTYGDIRFTASTPPPFMALAPERTVHLGSFSKTIAPGLRVGWAAADPAIAAAFVRGRTDLGTSPVAQRFVARFMESGEFDAHLRMVTDHYRRKRDLMLEALLRHCAGLAEWRQPDGGFFLWLNLLRSDVGAVTAAAEREKVSFLPGPHFSAVDPFTRNLRIAYGQVSESQIEEGIARLGRALQQAATS